uniref:helix-turn-helix domain-containing protein n=1 Tax=Pluralibacter gergoviae TaxID=61647 RepID=UPI0009BDFB70|nr:helix-turn-helix domain-containing protein [Pluralibacter gergoviae]
MTTASNGFVMLENDLLNLEKVAGKTFTGNMKITYSLIQGFEKNGQIAYFSQDTLKRQLGVTRQTVIKLLKDMVEMGLINKTEQVKGGTLNYTVNPITPEMVGTPEAPQRAAKAPEEVQALNHTAELVEAPEIVPATPGPEAPITLMTVYSEKVETVGEGLVQADPQPGETASVVPVVVPFPRGEIKEPSRDWDLDPAF